MNFARLKNIYTLGPSHRSILAAANHNHHQQHIHHRYTGSRADIFERDPFKVQSYNFHYAEKPRTTVQSHQLNKKHNQHSFRAYNSNPQLNKRNESKNLLGISRYQNYDKRCETHFLNRNFSNSNNNKSSNNHFYETRRRRFLQDSPRNPFAQDPPYRNPFKSYNSNAASKLCYLESSRSLLRPTASPFLKSICNQDGMKKLQPSNSCSSVSSKASLPRPQSSSGLNNLNKPTTSGNTLKSSKSLKLKDNSVCQININIIRSDDENSPDGNFKIEIETEKKNDFNLNMNKNNNRNNNNNNNNSNTKKNESLTNLLTKKHSWVRLRQTAQSPLNQTLTTPSQDSLKSRESSLFSIDSPPVRTSNSTRRLPSLVPWKPAVSHGSSHKLPLLPLNDYKKDLVPDFSFNLNKNHNDKTRASSSLRALTGSIENLRRLDSRTTFTNNLNRPQRIMQPCLDYTNISLEPSTCPRQSWALRPLAASSTNVPTYRDALTNFRL